MKSNTLKYCICIAILAFSYVSAKQSQCFGTLSKGTVENTVKLPLWGSNFVSYSKSLSILGRTYVHSAVYNILLNSFKSLETLEPEHTFVYAETGHKHGGPFKPHKTHQNGTSIDLHVPLLHLKSKKAMRFPSNIRNRFGYAIDFDANGINSDLQAKIDFNALAQLMLQLKSHSEKQGYKLKRILFAPNLQDDLYKTSLGKTVKKTIAIPNKRSWVRHDEHIHIDFNIPCLSYN